jgi:hypothetical protein
MGPGHQSDADFKIAKRKGIRAVKKSHLCEFGLDRIEVRQEAREWLTIFNKTL